MYYQTLFNGALAGLNGTNLMPAIIKVASVMLIASLLYSVYSAYTASGDVRILATAAIKYLIIGLVLVNYATVFQDVNDAFNGVANYIVSAGPGLTDVFRSWGQQLVAYWHNSSGVGGFTSFIWHFGQNIGAGLTSAILIFTAAALYRIAYLLFCLFYTVYGAILYVCGPFVLALMPATGIGRISRTYLINLMIFNAWGLIYAILAELIYVLHLNDVNTVLSNSSYLNLTVANPMVILAVASLLYAVIIALIPYVASRIMQGDVGATLLTVAGAALTAATVAASAAGTALMGAGGGWGYAGASTGGGPGGGGGSGSLASNSSPPKPPDIPGSAPPQPADGPGGSAGASADSVSSSQGSSSSSPAKPMSAEVSSKGGSTQASNGGGDSGAGAQSSRAAAGGGGSGGGRAAGGSKPIPMPWTPGSNVPGHRQGFSFTHAAAWYGAYAARSAYNRMSGANPGGDKKT